VVFGVVYLFFIHLWQTPEVKKMLDIHSNMRPTTAARHDKVRTKFNELYSQKIEGISLDLDGVYTKLSEHFCFSERTIRRILKGK
jgi:hypothetical protein